MKNFKVKYRKRLVKYVLARIQEDASATQILKIVDVIVAIWWLQETWKEVTNLTMKNCFEKCGIKGHNEQMEVEEDDDLKFEALVKEFTADIPATEYANFDEMFQRLGQWSMNSKSIGNNRSEKAALMRFRINQEIANDQVEEISDDDGSNDENDELEQEILGFKVIITTLVKIKRCPVFDNDSQDMLSTITKGI